MSSAKTNPQSPKCPACGKAISAGFAFLDGGALFMVDEQNSEPRKEMEGFLSVGYHGAGAESTAVIDLVEGAKMGQFELVFCSVDCLRSFLNGYVDELEEKLQRG